MRFNSQLSAVLSGQFLLEESAVPAFMVQMAQLLTATAGPSGARPEEMPMPDACFAITADAKSVQLGRYSSLDEVPTGSIAVTVVNGVMVPDDYYDWDYGYVAGTRTLGARIQQADAHPNIVAHVVHAITPGGSVLGTESLSDIIANTSKPLVGYVDMMCSAGMWAVCGADKIVVAKTGIMGSIGTKWDGIDMSGYLERMGFKQVTVTATDSVDKTRMFDEALKGKPGLLRTQMLDPLNNVFVAAVQEHRPSATPDTLTGKLFVGQAAIDNGLADQLGSLQDAIQLAFDLADEASSAATTGSTSSATNPNSFSTNPNPQPMSLFGKKTTALAAVLALAGKETIATADATAANEELRAAGITSAALITESNYTALSEKAARVDAAEKSVTTLTATVATLTASETKLQADLAASQAEVTRLGALAGAGHTTAPAAGEGAPAPKAAFFDPNAEHNKEAAALLG